LFLGRGHAAHGSADETEPARDARRPLQPPTIFGEEPARNIFVNRIGWNKLVSALCAAMLIAASGRSVSAGDGTDDSAPPPRAAGTGENSGQAATDASPPAAPASDRSDVKAPGKYWLAIQCEPASQAVRAQLQLPNDEGLVVVRVLSDGPAGKAGIRPNDLLLMAGDKGLSTVPELAAAIEAAKDQALTLKLLRGGKTLDATVRPALRPDSPQANRRSAEADHELVERWLKQFGMNTPGTWGNGITLVHPGAGLVLPPGVNVRPQLPDDMSINIYREGKKAAEITVKKGKETWKASEDDLTKLPQDIRREVEPLLHDGPVRIWFREMQSAPPNAANPGIAPGSQNTDRGDATPSSPESQSQPPSAQDLNDLSRRIDEMRRALDELRQRQENQQRADGASDGSASGR
jgi:hypothetical protein